MVAWWTSIQVDAIIRSIRYFVCLNMEVGNRRKPIWHHPAETCHSSSSAATYRPPIAECHSGAAPAGRRSDRESTSFLNSRPITSYRRAFSEAYPLPLHPAAGNLEELFDLRPWSTRPFAMLPVLQNISSDLQIRTPGHPQHRHPKRAALLGLTSESIRTRFTNSSDRAVRYHLQPQQRLRVIRSFEP